MTAPSGADGLDWVRSPVNWKSVPGVFTFVALIFLKPQLSRPYRASTDLLIIKSTSPRPDYFLMERTEG
jgi:hypothetical protein